MGKRLPEELEAPDLKLARERKEQRALESKKIPTKDLPPFEDDKSLLDSLPHTPPDVIAERIKQETPEEEEPEEEEPKYKKQEEIKKRGRPPLKKWRR